MSSKGVDLRSVPRSPLVERLQLASRGGPQPSPRTMQVLRRYGVDEDCKVNPERVLETLQDVITNEPTPENIYSFAEVAYLAGKATEKRDRDLALDYYTASVANAYLYLVGPACDAKRNPYDPQFRGACDLYNGALENMLRILQEQGALVAGRTHHFETANQSCELKVVVRSDLWHDEDLGDFKFVSDYEVKGLRNDYHTYGLGVPLIAVRETHEGESPHERYYPPGLTFPVTAFVRLLPPQPGESGAHHRALLELYDPTHSTDLTVRNIRLPLESDLSTPLAYFLNQADLRTFATHGLLNPESWQDRSGLFLTQPYQEGKIPVVFVHGLWSEPSAWAEMFNELQHDPRIRDNYQFWFYMYPTGQPFWMSAARMRKDLQKMRDELDPYGRNPAMGRVVLVGHSMGGLVAKLQTINSGEDYWASVSETPFQQVNASDEVKAKLAGAFFFRPDPTVRRVVTIGTPHRGSRFANGFTQWVFSKLITMPHYVTHGFQEIYRDNPGMFPKDSSMRVRNSIDSLSPSSPILSVLLRSRSPYVRYHNIVGVKSDGASGDGIVSLESARPGNVDSEIIVRAAHTDIHQHPLAILEVRRILLKHLDEVRNNCRRLGVITASGNLPTPGPTAPSTRAPWLQRNVPRDLPHNLPRYDPRYGSGFPGEGVYGPPQRLPRQPVAEPGR